jgi:hypothetical protein
MLLRKQVQSFPVLRRDHAVTPTSLCCDATADHDITPRRSLHLLRAGRDAEVRFFEDFAEPIVRLALELSVAKRRTHFHKISSEDPNSL